MRERISLAPDGSIHYCGPLGWRLITTNPPRGSDVVDWEQWPLGVPGSNDAARALAMARAWLWDISKLGIDHARSVRANQLLPDEPGTIMITDEDRKLADEFYRRIAEDGD